MAVPNLFVLLAAACAIAFARPIWGFGILLLLTSSLFHLDQYLTVSLGVGYIEPLEMIVISMCVLGVAAKPCSSQDSTSDRWHRHSTRRSPCFARIMDYRTLLPLAKSLYLQGVSDFLRFRHYAARTEISWSSPLGQSVRISKAA